MKSVQIAKLVERKTRTTYFTMPNDKEGGKRRKTKREAAGTDNREGSDSNGGRKKRRKIDKRKKEQKLRAWSTSDDAAEEEQRQEAAEETEKEKVKEKIHKKKRYNGRDSSIEGNVRQGKRSRQKDGAAASVNSNESAVKKKHRKKVRVTQDHQSHKKRPKEPKESRRSTRNKAPEGDVDGRKSDQEKDLGRGGQRETMKPWDTAKMNPMMMGAYAGHMGMMQPMMLPMMPGMMPPQPGMMPPHMMMGLPGRSGAGGWPRGRGARRSGASLPTDLTCDESVASSPEKVKKRQKKKSKDEVPPPSSSKSSSSSSSSNGEKPDAQSDLEFADTANGKSGSFDVESIEESPHSSVKDGQSSLVPEFNVAPATPPEAVQTVSEYMEGFKIGKRSPVPFTISPAAFEPVEPKVTSKVIASGVWQVDYQAPSLEEMQKSLSKEYCVAEVQTEDVSEETMQQCEDRWFMGYGGFVVASEQTVGSRSASSGSEKALRSDPQSHGAYRHQLRRRQLGSRSRSAQKESGAINEECENAADGADDDGGSSTSSSSSSSSGTPERQRAPSSEDEKPAPGSDGGQESAAPVLAPVLTDPRATISRAPSRGVTDYSDLA